ncbi:MAG: protein mobE [Desulfovibrio sp.]|jgi:hypothetical protein|nr:protein mobE [Desulfovibrio sp.]
MNTARVRQLEMLLGRTLCNEEVLRLERIGNILDIKDNDALWSAIAAMEYQRAYYEKLPAEIMNVAENTVKNLKAVADATIKASMESARADLAKAVVTVAHDVAVKVEGGRMWKWACGCILGAVVTVGGLCCGAYYKGNSAGVIVGRQYGYNLAKDEKAAADWANTPQGKMARHFAQFADIGEFARCDRKVWKKSKAKNTGKLACFPQSETSGWHIPPENELPLQNYPLPPTLQKR